MDAGRQNLQLSPQCRCLTWCVGAAEVCIGAQERATSIPATRWGAHGWQSRAAGAVTPLQAPGHRPGEPPLCRAGPGEALSHTRSEKTIPEDAQLGAARRWTGREEGSHQGCEASAMPPAKTPAFPCLAPSAGGRAAHALSAPSALGKQPGPGDASSATRTLLAARSTGSATAVVAVHAEGRWCPWAP